MKNKSVLVTGGARGIGKDIVETFAKNGYNVLINYNTSENEAFKLKEELSLKYKDVKIEIFKSDVSNRKQVNEMIEYMLKELNTIDVLVNNSGIAQDKIFNDISVEEFRHMLDVNVVGTFNVTQEVLNKYMINKKEGSIINISSIWGITGGSMEAAYSCTKAGIIGMSKALAKELGPSNIRVNVVAPGWIETDMTKSYDETSRNLFLEEIPLGRFGKTQDISELVYFLGSDKASYITGQVISPNGGYLI